MRAFRCRGFEEICSDGAHVLRSLNKNGYGESGSKYLNVDMLRSYALIMLMYRTRNERENIRSWAFVGMLDC